MIPEFAVPSCGELVIGEFTGLAGHERNGRTRCCPRRFLRSRVQVAASRAAKLVAPEVEELKNHRIDAGYPAIALKSRDRGPVRCWNERDRRADERSQVCAAPLPRTLAVAENVAELAPRTQRTADTTTENILLEYGTRLDSSIQEKIVGVEHIIAEELKRISVPLICSCSQHGVHNPAAIASLAGVVKAGLDLEFLDDVWAG